uniref:Sdz-33 F-box domain-containing protein n=1 Tax=Caenorhabditis japonica TaxID=281687 RepID=A0A8R1DKJ6_CAEJA
MDPADLVELSLCSTRLMHLITLTQFHPTYCNLTMRTSFDRKTEIEIGFLDSSKVSWQIVQNTYTKKKKLCAGAKIEKRSLWNGIAFKSSARLANTIYTFCTPSEFESFFKITAEYLLYLFPCRVRKVEFEMNFFSDLHMFTDWNKVHSCQNLRLRAFKSTNENIENVLKAVNVTKSIDIMGYSGDEVENSEILKLEEVKLDGALWFSKEKFLKMSSKKIEILDNNFGCATLNEAMHRWMKKEHENLESLTVSFPELDNESMQKLFHNLNWKTWDPSKRNRYFRKDDEHLYDCKNGLDIQRSDGKIATILYADHAFNFFVWNKSKSDSSLPCGMYFKRRPHQPIFDAKSFDTVSYGMAKLIFPVKIT